MLLDAGGDLADDVQVHGQEVLAGHAGLAGLAGRDDDNVRPGDVLVVRRPADVGVVVAVGGHLHQV